MAMRPQRPPVLDYATPQPRQPAKLGALIMGFLTGWFAGIPVTGILADIMTQTTQGHPHDGTMYTLAALAIVIEAPALGLLRLFLGPRRVNGVFAFLFGLGCGPLLLAVMIAVG